MPPRTPDAPELVLPAIQTAALGDGVQVRLVRRRSLSGLVGIAISLRAGYLHDPEGQEGLAELAVSFLRSPFGAPTLRPRLAGMGAYHWTRIGPRRLSLGCTVRKKHAAGALGALVRGLRELRVSDEAFASLRSDQDALLRATRGDPSAVAGLGLSRGFFALEPATRLLSSGSPATLSSLSPSAVQSWMAANIQPGGATFAFAGDVDLQEAGGWVEAGLGGWTGDGGKPEPPRRQPSEPSPPDVVQVPWPQLSPAFVAVGSRAGTGGTTPDAASDLAAGLLRGGISGELRERRRLAYGLSSDRLATRGGRIRSFATPVEPHELPRTVELIRGVQRDLSGPLKISSRWLADYRRANALGALADYESVDRLVRFLVDTVEDGLSVRQIEERVDQLKTLSPTEVGLALQAVGRPENLRLCLVADPESIAGAKKALAGLNVVTRTADQLIGEFS